jgi:RNA polymerase sigma-70 factor (ECF subfamily)
MSLTPEADARDRADMEQLQAGRAAALNDLMDRHAAPLFHFLHRLTGNEEDANDLAQETFVRVFKSKDSFRLDQKFSTWIFTIAANLARNHFRWRGRHPQVSLEAESAETESSLGSALPSPSLSPQEEALAVERARAVRSAVAALPPDLREALVLCEWEECSVAAAAEILKTTPKAVESRLHRARQTLRTRLQGWL